MNLYEVLCLCVCHLGGVGGCEQSVGSAGVLRAAGAADAVHVVLGVVRVVVVYHKLHVLHICTHCYSRQCTLHKYIYTGIFISR